MTAAVRAFNKHIVDYQIHLHPTYHLINYILASLAGGVLKTTQFLQAQEIRKSDLQHLNMIFPLATPAIHMQVILSH